MARNEISITAPPEDVFAVLRDPRSYSRWVVGSREVRASDEAWPERGTAFDHTVGTGPFGLKDHTVVEEVDPPHLLRLKARARPFPSATVTLRLAREGTGTRVTMIEDPAFPLGSIAIGPLGHAAIRVRNAESLRRLKRLAEERETVPGDELPSRRTHAPARDARAGGARRTAGATTRN